MLMISENRTTVDISVGGSEITGSYGYGVFYGGTGISGHAALGESRLSWRRR